MLQARAAAAGAVPTSTLLLLVLALALALLPPAPVRAQATKNGSAAGAAGQLATDINYDSMIEIRYENLERRAGQDAAAWLRAHAPRDASGQPVFQICVAPSQPYAVCNVSNPSTAFSGFEVELFRNVAPRVAWLGDEGERWRFKCAEFSDVYNLLETATGACLLTMGGFKSVGQQSSDSSASYINKGLAILTLARKSYHQKLFSPFLAFSWELWLALITTAVAVSCILWALDTSVRAMDHAAGEADEAAGGAGGGGGQDCPLCRCGIHGALWNQSGAADAESGPEVSREPSAAVKSQPSKTASLSGADPVPERAHGKKLVELLDRAHTDGAIAAMKNLDETLRVVLLNLAKASRTPSTSTLPSQLVLWAWGLLTMITISMFTGAIAAALTANPYVSGVRTLADLRGRPVIIARGQEHRFVKSGLVLKPYPWEDLDDEQAMLQGLRSHQADAIVMDSNWVKYNAGRFCDLIMAGEPWLERFVAFKWHVNATDAMVDDLDVAIKQAMLEGVVSDLRERLVTSPSRGCSDHFALTKKTRVDFYQVAGLWIILGFSVVAAFAITTFLFVTRRARRRQRERLHSVIKSASRPLSGLGSPRPD